MDDLRLANYGGSLARDSIRSLLGGAVAADWRHALIARGFGWNTTVGAVSTGIVGGGNGTTVVLARPQLAIKVPTGQCLVPLRVSVEVELGLQTTDSHVTEILVSIDRTQVPTAGTSTTEVPINMRTDITVPCPLTVWSAFTGDTGVALALDELDRAQALTDVQGVATTVNVYQLKTVYDPRWPPFICGPAGFFVHYGGDIAATGFIQASFLAIPSSLVTSLI